MNKLIVAGCSVSDYTKVKKVWGEYLAEKLNYKYVHEARGCGSNYRMWRTLASKIISGVIDSEDTIIIQYTTPERNEFYSYNRFDKNPNTMREKYSKGSIIRFKFGSYDFGYDRYESKFLKLYERFINLEFEKEKFQNNNIMFQCLTKEYNIKNLYFVKVGGYSGDWTTLINDYKDNFFKYEDIFENSENHLPGDSYHLSDQGHRLLADKIYKEMKK